MYQQWHSLVARPSLVPVFCIRQVTKNGAREGRAGNKAMLYATYSHSQYNVGLFSSCRLPVSCVHVSALLHALVALKPAEHSHPLSDDSDEEAVPVASVPCWWKQPKKRNESLRSMITEKLKSK